MKRREMYYYKTEAMNLLGLTSKAFERLNIEPARTIKNQYCKTCYLYEKRLIEDLMKNRPVSLCG